MVCIIIARARRLVILAMAFITIVGGCLGYMVYIKAKAVNNLLSGTELVVIERDVPQTRNLIPVINHEVMVVNTSSREIVVDIKSPIPEKLYMKGDFYPEFGRSSLLAAPIESPYSLDIKSYTLLGMPSVESNGDRTDFIWHNVKIPPRCAVIAQYDCFFGDKDRFGSETGLNIAGLMVDEEYSIRKTSKDTTLRFEYILRNLEKTPIEELMLGIFIPDTILGDDGGDTLLFHVSNISTIPELNIDRSTISDGTGKAASGSDIYYIQRSLQPLKEYKLKIEITGNTGEAGSICPLITLQAKCQGERIWPRSQVIGDSDMNIENFYYWHLSLILPDHIYFMIDRNGEINTVTGWPQ